MVTFYFCFVFVLFYFCYNINIFFKEKSNSGVCDMDKNSSSSIAKEKLIDSIEIINNKASNNIITNLNENNASNSSSGNRKSLNKSNDSDNSNSTSASSKNSTQNRSSNFYKNLITPVKSGKATFEPNKLNKKLNATNNENSDIRTMTTTQFFPYLD